MQVIDFLEARIAEDEEAARLGYLNSVLQPIYDGGRLFQRTVEIPPAVKNRVMAECEAKRKIIAHCTRSDGGAAPAAGQDCMERVLFVLAQVYRHHPDFSHDWAA